MTELVYLAARMGWKAKMRLVAGCLAAHGIEVTSRWVFRGDEGDRSEAACAMEDLEDIDRAGSLVLFSADSMGVGRHIEFGYALANSKRLFVVAERESVFHYLPRVVVCHSVDALIASLAGSGF